MAPTAPRPTLAALALAAALVGYFWWQGERFLAANGPTFDEGAHLAAGYAYWTTGDFSLNREHPPLLKLLWALPMALGGGPPFPREVATETNNDHWHIANALLYQSGVPHMPPFTAARRMNLAVGCGVLLLVGWWALRVWKSNLAGIAAVAFAAFDPNLLALSCVLSTDAGLAFFSLLSAYLLWEYTERPSRGWMIAAGVSLGLMLSTKFSALGMVAGLMLAGVLWAKRTKQLGAFDFAFRLGLISLITLAATYGFVNFPEWGSGLKFQLSRAKYGDGVMFLNGELSRTGWYHYFLIVLLLKLPLGLLLAGGTGLWPVQGSTGQRPVPPNAWLVIPPLVFFLAASASRVDTGVRIVLPILPFLYILAARLAVGALWQRGLMILCLAWCGVASWIAAPHSIAYFNEIGNGNARLADSNLDWGQSLPELKQYIDCEGLGTIYLSYFGTDRPEAYGIRYQPLPGYGRVGPPLSTKVPESESRQIVAVSANHLLGLYLNEPESFAWLRERKPNAVAGSIHIFDLTGDTDAIRRIREMSP